MRKLILSILLAPMAFSSQSVRADDCTTMLKPLFDYVGGTNSAYVGAIRYHSYGISGQFELIKYSVGRMWPGSSTYVCGVLPIKYCTVRTLQNKIWTRVNTDTSPQIDMSAPGKYGLNLTVTSSGQTTVEELIGGNAIPGSKNVFTPLYSSGLLTFVDASRGDAWVISFREDKTPN